MTTRQQYNPRQLLYIAHKKIRLLLRKPEIISAILSSHVTSEIMKKKKRIKPYHGYRCMVKSYDISVGRQKSKIFLDVH